MTYRAPGRSNRSGRTQADNDVFEGLPVKQWSQSITHISLALPKHEEELDQNDKWGEPPLPRDWASLLPWTQQLLRLARSGKVGTKRKSDAEPLDDEKGEDELGETGKGSLEDRAYQAKKWRPTPEGLLEAEHRHFEFLAKRRKGLPNLYGPDAQSGVPVQMRKTKVQKTSADGETLVYEVLVPEGHTVEGEVTEIAELSNVEPVIAAPGTVIEGVGIANDEGVIVAEHLKPAPAPRRNRPPPKKKGGPGRGKKRVTFTNPDGSTYTTVVPNATKIVPQPGQTVRHVAKGEEATADVTAEQAAAHAASTGEQGLADGDDGEEGDGSDEGDDEGDDDEDREEGEVTEEDIQTTDVTPVPPETAVHAAVVVDPNPDQNDDVDIGPPFHITQPADPLTTGIGTMSDGQDRSSSPEVALASSSHSRQNSQGGIPGMHAVAAQDITFSSTDSQERVDAGLSDELDRPVVASTAEQQAKAEAGTAPTRIEEGQEDLLGSLEKTLNNGSERDNENHHEDE